MKFFGASPLKHRHNIKILIYSHFFAPSIGGVETIVLSLARGLAEANLGNNSFRMEVTVVTKTPADKHDDSALPFRVVRRPKLLDLLRLILGCDVLHIAGPALLPLALGRLLFKPTVVEHHGYQAICPNGLLLRQPERTLCPGHFQAGQYLKCVHCRAAELSRPKSLQSVSTTALRNLLCRYATVNIGVTNHVLERHLLPHSRCIYHGVPATSCASGPFPTTPDRVCFAFLGRFVQEKGASVVLEAAARLMEQGLDFDLQLIGDGPQRPELEAIIGTRGLANKVALPGYLTGNALQEALAKIDVVIAPSICEETAGLSAIEQMMAGRVVIASAIGGLCEVVGDGGLLFAPGDSTALASHMKALLLTPSLLGPLAEKGRVRALRLFDRHRMIQEHCRLYVELSRT